jgi:hypothetical protein
MTETAQTLTSGTTDLPRKLVGSRCSPKIAADDWLALGSSSGHNGEEKTKYERTPDPDIPLTELQLEDVRRTHSMLLSTHGLQTAYTEVLERCQLDKRGHPSQTVHIQVLVQVWRVLRKHL